MRLATLITSHNRRDKTLGCLHALFGCKLPAGLQLSVILVDDCSDDGTEDAVRHQFPSVEIVRGTGQLYWNRGMHRAFARAMAASGFEAFLWLNDDTVLFPDALSRLLQTLDLSVTGERCERIVVGTTKDPETGQPTYGGLKRASRWRPLHFSLVQPRADAVLCDTMNGNCVLISAAAARLLGNLDPIFAHAMGDIDYGLRAKKRGVRLLVAPGFIGHCSRNPTSGSFRDLSVPIHARLRLMRRPKGLPPKSWLTLTARHAGALWPVYFVWPYLRVLIGR